MNPSISVITLGVDDLKRSLAFYQDGVDVARAANEVLLSHNVSSRSSVDDVMVEAERAGAEIIKPAKDLFWGGYGGFFKDPDGHIWEVTWNPAWN